MLYCNCHVAQENRRKVAGGKGYHMKKKILAFILAAVMAFSLGACGNTGEDTASDGAGEGQASQTVETDSQEGEADPEAGQESAQGSEGSAGEEQITLRYAYWGSTYENEAMQGIAAKYEEENPNVHIECIYIPNADYTTKMTAMVASGDEPDIANLFPSDFIGWADEGRFVNLYEMIETDERYEVEDFIPNCFFETSDGYAGGRSIANELIQLYYNKDLFDEQGVEYLPANPDEALSWDEFVEVCQKLTIDENGNNALSPEFDPDRIVTYGFDFDKNNMTWGAFVYQNGGSVLNEEGTEFNMTDPKTVDALQKISDLINVYHVSPDPLTSSGSNMSVTSSLQSKQVAIICDGTWTNLDLGSIDINYDVACLPDMSGTPCFETTASACVIFNTCENVDVAWDFMMYLADPSNALDLYSSGLWMPIMREWYEDEELLNSWASPGTTSHTEGFYDAAVRYTDYDYRLAPESCVVGWSKLDAVIESALDSVWLGEKSAEDAMNEIKPAVDGMVSGFINFR